MADGLNQARALRVHEIMGDFRNIQAYIAAIRANPSAEEYNEEGYTVLRRCVQEAQALLAQPFNAQAGLVGDPEQDRTNLRRIITDAAVRRFRAQRIYLRATAALRWVNSRAAILQGQRPHAGHAAALQQARASLRQELTAITDRRVFDSLRAADQANGLWLNEDPSLNAMQTALESGEYPPPPDIEQESRASEEERDPDLEDLED